MELSDAGAKALIQREGFRNTAYRDTKGILTIGVGHTGPEVRAGLTWTDEQVEEAFKKDVKWAVEAVNKVLQPLTQNMFDALVSFTFNVGKAAFLNSTMRKLLDKGDYAGAKAQFDRWHIPKEIIGRRNSERDQFGK